MFPVYYTDLCNFLSCKLKPQECSRKTNIEQCTWECVYWERFPPNQQWNEKYTLTQGSQGQFYKTGSESQGQRSDRRQPRRCTRKPTLADWLTTWTALTHRAQPESPRPPTRCILTAELAATTRLVQMSALHRLMGQRGRRSTGNAWDPGQEVSELQGERERMKDN